MPSMIETMFMQDISKACAEAGPVCLETSLSVEETIATLTRELNAAKGKVHGLLIIAVSDDVNERGESGVSFNAGMAGPVNVLAALSAASAVMLRVETMKETARKLGLEQHPMFESLFAGSNTKSGNPKEMYKVPEGTQTN